MVCIHCREVITARTLGEERVGSQRAGLFLGIFAADGLRAWKGMEAVQ